MKKLLIVTAALSAFAAAYAGDDRSSAAREGATPSRVSHHTIPQQPKKDWKISDKDYAALLDECGQTTSYPLADQHHSATGVEK